jgi:hypothetical protein
MGRVAASVVRTDPGFYEETRQVIEWCTSHADNSYFAYHSFSNLYYVLRSQRDGVTAVAYLKGLLAWDQRRTHLTAAIDRFRGS